MRHSTSVLRLPLVVAFLALLLAGPSACGGSPGGEFVFLHVFNGYPAADSMDLYGPQGTVAEGLEYGKRTNSFQRVNRNLGTNFELYYQGAPETFDISLPLYSLYPQETATVFFKGREGPSSAAAPVIYRHLQTGHDNSSVANQTGTPEGFGLCRLVLDNALSVESLNLTNFEFAPAFKINPACTGYARTIGTYDDSGTSIETESGRTIQVGRPRLWETGENAETPATHPWFFPAEPEGSQVVEVRDPDSCPVFGERRASGDGGVSFVWARNISGNFEGGNIQATVPTHRYVDCIGWDTTAPPEDQEVTVEDVRSCQQVGVTASTVSPGPGIVRFEFPTGFGLKLNGDPVPPDQCGFALRVYSDFFNIFVQTGEESTDYFEENITFRPNQYRFWTLYGRPVNPRSEQWSSARQVSRNPNAPGAGGGIVSLEEYTRQSGSSNGGGN